MLNGPSTAKIVLSTLFSLGLYHFYWFSRSRRDIERSANTQLIPTTWLLAIPGAGYWWFWRYAEALETVSFGRLKKSETYMLYILATHAPLTVFSTYAYFPGSNETSTIILFLIISAIIVLVLYICAMAALISILQQKIHALQPSSAVL